MCKHDAFFSGVWYTCASVGAKLRVTSASTQQTMRETSQSHPHIKMGVIFRKHGLSARELVLFQS